VGRHAEVCQASGVAFGFVRNISDPVQNAALPAEVQGNWGCAIYESYGVYTSYNGAMTAWAMLAGGFQAAYSARTALVRLRG
jgi:hypothetical protein